MGPFDMNLDEQFHSLSVIFDDYLKIVMRNVNSHQSEEMHYEEKKNI